MVAKKHTDKLNEIKKNIEQAHEYFIKNVNRFNDFMKFVFQTSLSSDDITKLDVLQKPAIEFNILEAMISRLRGEFAKQEPSIVARAADGVRIEELTPEFLQTLEIIEAHLREIFFDASNDALEYNIYSDLLAGGYSVVYVYTGYINELSFEQNIKVERVFDPTLTGFDPLARESHKGDGNYCFQLIPKSKEDFEEEFGKGSADNMKFERSSAVGDFNWSYLNQDQEIILVADYYCKKKKKEKIVKLSNGHTIVKKHYEEFLKLWGNQGFIEQAPIIIEERDTVIETIDRYMVCEDKVLSHEETCYKFLPLVFIDGNSVVIRENEDGASMQMTRPFVYHAKGVQKLKNFSGQTIGAEIENMVQHKFMVAVESIPEDYADAYKNVQQASTLVYNAFYKDNPEQPLPPPREVQRTPTPDIVNMTFMGTDQVTQTILGTYDSILGTNDKQISGVAIQQGAMQSNAAAIPYLQGYIRGLNRIAHIVVDLIPKFYVTPRSLPVKAPDGKRSYQIINHPNNPNSVDFSYNPNSLQIKVEAGVSSAVQKQVALDQIIRMMQSSQLFAEFINTMGLETILDNMDIRGIEGLKAQAVQFMKQLEEQKAQQAQQGNPEETAMREQTEAIKEIEMAKIQQQQQKQEGELAIQAAKVANEKTLTDVKFMQIMAQINQNQTKLGIEQEKVDSENARTAIEQAMQHVQNLRKNVEDNHK
jgi:hypothetical protein